MQDKVEYWLNLCDSDLDVAKYMLKGNYYLYAGFMCHQVVEKALKAMVADKTDVIPPKIHDLRKLARLSDVFDTLLEEHITLINKVSPLQIEARYPEYKEKIAETLSKEYCKELIEETEAFLCWIKQKLEK